MNEAHVGAHVIGPPSGWILRRNRRAPTVAFRCDGRPRAGRRPRRKASLVIPIRPRSRGGTSPNRTRVADYCCGNTRRPAGSKLETPTIGPICCGNGQGGRLRASFNATETVEFQPGELAEVRERHSARSSGASRIATNAQAFGGSRSPGVVPGSNEQPTPDPPRERCKPPRSTPPGCGRRRCPRRARINIYSADKPAPFGTGGAEVNDFIRAGDVDPR